jgi:hypothetical protein
MILPNTSHDDERPDAQVADEPAEDDAIRAQVRRLARRHPAGGQVIERAAIVAAGADSAAIMSWVTAHAGEPEAAAAASAKGGLHGSHSAPGRPPLRYVLPPGALD